MIVRVDTVVNSESNFTFRYWERVWTENDTVALEPSIIRTDLNVSAKKLLNETHSVYFLVYDNNRKEGAPACCTAQQDKQGRCKEGMLVLGTCSCL